MKLGHVALLLAILGWTAWYLSDALRVSSNIRNLILIVPTAAIVVLAALFELGRQGALALGWSRPVADESDSATGVERQQGKIDILRGVALLGMLGALVFSMSTVGFDLAIFVFLFSSLILLERGKVLKKLVFAAAFTFIVVGGARILLPFPMYTIIL